MLQKKITISNKLGLHARAAAKLVSLTSKYSAHIEIANKTKKVNGKSIMGVMMLAAAMGSELEFTIDGDDEKDLLVAVEKLVNNKFNEEE